jgi:hypothetical protein
LLRWHSLVKLENISDEFCKVFRDSKHPDWDLTFKGNDSAAGLTSSGAASNSAASSDGAGIEKSCSSQVRKHSDVEEVSRMLSTQLMIEPTLAQRHLNQSLNAFHYFCSMNNVNGFIPFLMEMLPLMRKLSLPLLSKIPIPNKLEIASPHLLTGVARVFNLEIAAFDVEKKDQVILAILRVRRCVWRSLYPPLPSTR